MNKLYSDKVVAKLRAVPVAVWVLLLLVSFYFAHAYELLLTAEYYAFTVGEVYQELGINVNAVTVGVLFSILEAAVYLVVFEILIAITYNLAAGRFRCQINRQDFKFRLRYFMLVLNLIIGVCSVGYFFTQYENGVINPHIVLFGDKVNILTATNPYYSIQNSVLPFTVAAVMALLFFEDFRSRYVPKRNQTALFSRFAMIFIGINVLFFVYQLFSDFLIVKNPNPATVPEIIAYSLEAASYVAASVGYYFYYLKIKKEPDVEFIINDDNDKGGSDKIYDDFGF